MSAELLPDLHDMVQMLAIAIFGWFLIMRLGSALKVEKKVCQYIYVWHFFFGLVFFIYTLNVVSDSTSYYQSSYYMNEVEFSLGTNFVYIFYDWLISFFSLSYLSISFFISFLGASGLLLLYATLQELSGYSPSLKHVTLIAVFLPSLSFWTGGLGKDALMFLCINAVLWASVRPKSRYLIMMVGIILMFLVRPHIAVPFFLLVLVSLYSIVKLRAKVKVAIGLPLLLAFGYIALVGLEQIGLSWESAGNFIDSRVYYTGLGSGSFFALQDANFMQSFFNFVYFPILTDQLSIKHVPLIIEGGIVFFISIFMLIKGNLRSINCPLRFFAVFLVFLAITFALSLTLSNYGLIFRQKIMVIPLLYYLLFSIPEKGVSNP